MVNEMVVCNEIVVRWFVRWLCDGYEVNTRFVFLMWCEWLYFRVGNYKICLYSMFGLFDMAVLRKRKAGSF